MIAYFDTSALVPLVVAEPSSPLCGRVWDAAEVVASSRLAYVEATAALARAQWLGRLTAEDQRRSLRVLDEIWTEVDVVSVDELLVHEAAALATAHALRGHDAVHCASALRLTDLDVVGVSGDGELITAWQERGVDVVDTRR